MARAADQISLPIGWVSAAAFATWGLLFAAQLGWLPFTRYAWAFNLWSYFPVWVMALFAATSLVLCVGRVRSAVARSAGALSARAGALPPRVQDVALFVAVSLLLWLLRERMLIADSWLLYSSAVRAGWLFVFPDVGASFFMRSAAHADFVPLPAAQRLQLAYCLCGGLAALLALRVGRRLGGGTAGAAIVALLLLTGGMARVFAGHVETYSVVLCAVLFYFWMALAYIEGDVAWWLPCLALGIAGWLHLSALYLVPTIVLLPRLASAELSGRDWVVTLARGAPIAVAPMIGFWGLAWALGHSADVERGFHVMTEVIAGAKTEEGLNKQWWVRIGGERAEVGLDYVFMSGAHLKYLINSAHVLMPFSMGIVVAVAVGRRSAFATPAARLLVTAALPTIVYAFMLRPFWGPFDWDLFAITACCVSLLAGHLLVTGFEAATRAQLAVWLIGFQILFVGLPFLVLGIVQPRDAGPFIGKQYLRTIVEQPPGGEPEGALVPWL